DNFSQFKSLPQVSYCKVFIYVSLTSLYIHFTEVRIIVRNLSPNRAPGSDGISNLAVKIYPSKLYSFCSKYLNTVLSYSISRMSLTAIIAFSCSALQVLLQNCSQLEKLRANLKIISQQQNCDQQIKECIKHHQMILKYMQDMEDVINKELMGQFFIILGGMCCASFSCAMSWGNLLQMSQCAVAYSGFMVQLYAYCWIGHELTRQAESIRTAAWECDWVGAPIHVQDNVSFVIAMASKDFVLTAGKYVPVSRTTMMNVSSHSL
ncbi:hypothetical protein L9F63_009804, partial [Diploptera punctata]